MEYIFIILTLFGIGCCCFYVVDRYKYRQFRLNVKAGNMCYIKDYDYSVQIIAFIENTAKVRTIEGVKYVHVDNLYPIPGYDYL